MNSCGRLLWLMLLSWGALLSAQVRAELVLVPEAKEARLTVTIEPGWEISSLTQPEGGTMRTEIKVVEPYRLAGEIKAPKPKVQENSVFGVRLEKYRGTVVFTLPIKGDWSPGSEVAVELTYQLCNEENCLFPQTDRVKAKVPEKPVAG